MSGFWHLVFYKPLYNVLVWLVTNLPFHSMFFAIVILTIVVRIILYPFSYKSLKTQIQMSRVKGKLKEIQEKYEDKQEQARKTMELYREHKINPFSSFLTILVQLPLIIALYKVFRDFATKGFDSTLLYHFVNAPETITLHQFGIDLTGKSIALAILVGVSQYFYLHISSKMRKEVEKKAGVENIKKSSHEKMIESLGSSMKYTMPFFVGFISYIAGSALSLYWFVSNLFLLGQEIVIHKRVERGELAKENTA